MAMRGGPARRLPGNPLGGVLRDMNRQARRPTRRTMPDEPVEAAQGSVERAPAAPAPAASLPVLEAATVARTDAEGRAWWAFPSLFAVPPVLTAVAVAAVPVSVVVEEVANDHAVVRAWTPTGWAGDGLVLHLTARAASG